MKVGKKLAADAGESRDAGGVTDDEKSNPKAPVCIC